MQIQQIFNTSGSSSTALDVFPRRLASLVHLPCMDTKNTHLTLASTTDEHDLSAVMSISELAAYLHVAVQTIYDLRCQGRGPRGFRVGREIRFRLREVEAWLSRMEHDDADRHMAGRTPEKPR